MQVIPHHRHATNLSLSERWISGFGGGLLTVLGVRRRSIGGAAMAVAGGMLIRRAVTGHCAVYEAIGIRTAPLGQGAETTSVPYELGIRVDRAITIAKPRSEVFRFWREFTNLPRFMKHLESVRPASEKRSHWVVRGPAGRSVEWDAEIHNEIANELIAWRSLPGADVDSAGSVWFKDAPAGRGTEIKVELQYNPPAGTLGAAFAMLFGREPGRQIEEDLRRLKQILEIGEVVTTEGQTSGREAARPGRGRGREDREVEFASQSSFPASDAPSYNP